MAKMETVATGVDFFDSGPQFRRGRLYLGFGISGTGKSVLGLQFACAGLLGGEKVLYVCREKPEDLVQLGESLGLPLAEHLDDERLVVLQYCDSISEIVAERGSEAVLGELCSEIESPSCVSPSMTGRTRTGNSDLTISMASARRVRSAASVKSVAATLRKSVSSIQD